jgi:hypothetical protein
VKVGLLGLSEPNMNKLVASVVVCVMSGLGLNSSHQYSEKPFLLSPRVDREIACKIALSQEDVIKWLKKPVCQRANEYKTYWMVGVMSENDYSFGGVCLIKIDKKTGAVIRIIRGR